MDELTATRVPLRPVLWPGVAWGASVLVLGSLAAGMLDRLAENSTLPGIDVTVDILDLNQEASLGTWFSVVVLAAIVVLSALLAGSARERSERQAWWLLSGLLLLVSVDEITTVHEHLSGLIEERLEVSKVLWVLPVAVVLLAVMFVLVRLLSRTPELPRLEIVLGLGLMGIGALGLELLSGDIGGRGDGWSYWLQATTEEAFELAGLAVLCRAVVVHLERSGTSITLGQEPRLD